MSSSQKVQVNRLVLSKSKLDSFLVWTISLIAIFEAHLEVFLGDNFLPLVEGVIVLGVLLFLLRSMFSTKIGLTELHICLFVSIIWASGVIKTVNFNQLLLGVFFISKPFLAFLCGLQLQIDSRRLSKLFLFFCYLALLSIPISFLQFIGYEINPFNFILNSSGVIGLLDNPNKNAQLMLYGYLILSNHPKGMVKKVLIPLFLFGILFSGSRQGLIFFFITLFIQEIVIKKRWKLILTTIPFIVLLLTVFSQAFLSRFYSLQERINSGEYFRLKAVISKLLNTL